MSFSRQVPEPSQVSGSVHSDFIEEPQLDPEGLNLLAGQDLEVPSHISATSQSPLAERQTVLESAT